MFLQVSVCPWGGIGLISSWGGAWADTHPPSPWDQTHLPGTRPPLSPWDQTHPPPGLDPPWADTPLPLGPDPPWADTPLSPWDQTPPGRPPPASLWDQTPPDTVYVRAVRILLECNLVTLSSDKGKKKIAFAKYKITLQRQVCLKPRIATLLS